VSSPDLEAQATPRIKDALDTAIQRTGIEEFARISGIKTSFLDKVLQSDGEFVPVSIVTLACQINKSHNDSNPAHSSISECLRGAILRLPQQRSNIETAITDDSTPRSRRAKFLKGQRRAGRIYDPTALRVTEFMSSFITFLILGYFLGGIALGPLFGFGSCVGVVTTPPWISPCLGSGIGLVFGSVGGLAYTYYYFVKRL